MASARRARYTYEGGRQIYLDGEPFISVGREGETRPADADDVAQLIADLLNRARYLPQYTMGARARRESRARDRDRDSRRGRR